MSERPTQPPVEVRIESAGATVSIKAHGRWKEVLLSCEVAHAEAVERAKKQPRGFVA